jgi:hypothetical protein
MNDLPAHLRPESCYVCGGTEHPPVEGGHAYWSNADAAAYFRAEDRGRSVRYSDGTTSPEANYVNQHRPY